MTKTETGLRWIVPIIVGGILLAQIYILHYFDQMYLNFKAVIGFILIVLVIFEIDRKITRYFQQKYPDSKRFSTRILFPFLVSLFAGIICCFFRLHSVKNLGN